MMLIKKMGGGGGRVEVINGKGCSKRFVDFSSSFRANPLFSLESLFPASPASALSQSPVQMVRPISDGPFSGLVICVTGLSKETRKQVKEATERLGGQYSPHLHPQCTHLVVQSSQGPKFEHAMKHWQANGLLLVTIGWFVDSVKRNVRLNESLYRMNNVGDLGNVLKRIDQNSGVEKGCHPVGSCKTTTKQSDVIEFPGFQFSERESKRQSVSSFFSGETYYVDIDIPIELRTKVVEALSTEGANLLDQWFIGCKSSHVVCEGPTVRKYLGHSSNVVTPLWVLKSVKEKRVQRLVHLSGDLARYTGAMLDSSMNGFSKEEVHRESSSGSFASSVNKFGHDERQMRVNIAKDGVRKRRNFRMQTCQTPIRPLTPSNLLDSICWSISEPTSSVSVYTDASSIENTIGDQISIFFDAKEAGKESVTSFLNLSRALTESEKSELIFKGPFLTVLFPVDRFSEMGPCSKTFFSTKGFTCLQILDHIYEFYQENMSSEEIELAIYTDSRHADRLRSAYSSKEMTGEVKFKRIEFLGSRRSFEMLKRVSGDNCGNVYELLIRA